jgi:hypothetical protein
MSKKEYGYSGEIRGSEIAYRPIVGIFLTHEKCEYKGIALIDSGSDCSVASADFADVLGIDSSKCRKGRMVAVVGSSSESFIAEVGLRVDGFDDTFPIQMRFVEGTNTGILLGQKDFFEFFTVIFEKRKRKFSLEREE